MTSLIEIRDVTKSYGAGPPALNNVSLTVDAGEALAVTGPSGSGKSTLLNLIAGLDKPSVGKVTVDGVGVDGMTEAASARYRRAKVGLVFQFFNLLDDLTVRDNVLLPAQLQDWPGMRRGDAPLCCWSTWVSRRTPTPTRAGSRAANASGWRSLGH